MKLVFTSALMLIMLVSHALPMANDSSDKDKKSKSNPSNPTLTTTMSMQQLQEENAFLKARLAELETKTEDEKSMLQYRYTMLKLVTMLDKNDNSDKMEDLKSQLNFSKMLSSTLQILNTGQGR